MSTIKRNYAYDVGYTASALPNWTLTCTKAGTTSSDPITVQEGTIIDGTCEWNCVNNVGGGGGAGYSNVIKDTIYEGDVQVTATSEVNYALTSPADNYDYAICTVKITYTNGLNSRATTVVPANQSSSMGWTYGVGAHGSGQAYGWIGFKANKTSIRFGLWEKGSNVSSVSLERVDGFKVNTMTLS